MLVLEGGRRMKLDKNGYQIWRLSRILIRNSGLTTGGRLSLYLLVAETILWPQLSGIHCVSASSSGNGISTRFIVLASKWAERQIQYLVFSDPTVLAAVDVIRTLQHSGVAEKTESKHFWYYLLLSTVKCLYVQSIIGMMLVHFHLANKQIQSIHCLT